MAVLLGGLTRSQGVDAGFPISSVEGDTLKLGDDIPI